ncbi:MAG: hypothetical protein KF760_21010 [Candidatus Eremiobacteraeota bacterium]|nr:hypothetical protein [Candidatus Eremiobacteraeota bacterium]
MLELPVNVTILSLLVMIGIAFLPPKLPTVLRNIMIQMAFGGFIYFALFGAQFNLPAGLPMSGLFGGYIDPSLPLFNKLSFGFIAPLLGIVVSILVGIVRFIINRKKSGNSDD